MIDLQYIRQKIIESIKNSELSQTELAKRLGVNSATISHYVRGTKMPALDTFANLCIVLDLDANDILGVSITEYKKSANKD